MIIIIEFIINCIIMITVEYTIDDSHITIDSSQKRYTSLSPSSSVDRIIIRIVIISFLN